MGGGPEKLLTLEEAARRLGVPADDVEAMIQSGRLPAFRLGGSLLRVRLTDLEAIRPPTVPSPRPASPPGAEGMNFLSRLTEFVYFNDFYLIALLALLILLAVIFAL